MIITNRKAYHDFDIIEEYTAGISLLGPEVKALNEGKASLKDSFISIRNREAIWKNGHLTIPNYVTIDRPEEKRDRKLLLTKKQLRKLEEETTQKGLTLVPIKITKVKNKYKLVIGLAKGLKKYDKRQKLKEKDQKRDIERAIKNREYL